MPRPVICFFWCKLCRPEHFGCAALSLASAGIRRRHHALRSDPVQNTDAAAALETVFCDAGDGRPLFGMLAAPGSEFTCQCPHILCLRASGRELPFRPRKCHGHHYVHWQSQKRNLLSRPVFSEPERSMDTQGRAVLWNDPVFRPGCCGGKLPDPAVCRKSHPALSLSSDDGISPYAVPPGHSVAAAVMMWCSSSSTGSRILPPSPPARPYLYPSDNPPVWPLTGWILVRS